MHRLLSVLLLAAVNAAAQSASQASQPNPAQSPATAATPSKLGQATIAFQNHDYVRARALLREVINADPNNVEAHDMDSLCSVRLKDYPAAVSSLNRALQLRPDAGYLLAQLMRAYALGGYSAEIGATRDRIRRLQSQGRLPSGFYYVSDTFEVGARR